MSLVPILYTSLLLFTALMVIVITVSYISFKIRKRNERINQEEREQFSGSRVRYSAEPSFQPRSRSIKVVSTIKNPELRRTAELPYYTGERPRDNIRSTRATSNVLPRPKYTIHETNNETETVDTSRNEKTEFARTRTSQQKNRIEILNTQKNKKGNQPRERYQASGSGSIALPKYYAGFHHTKSCE